MTVAEPTWAPLLRKLWADPDIAPDQIAARMGVAQPTVFARVHSLGLPSRSGWGSSDWSDERVELLKKLWGEGKSAGQIAQELRGVSRNAVIGKVLRLGLSGRAAASAPKRAAVVRAVAPVKARAVPSAESHVFPVVKPLPAERAEAPGLCASLLDLTAHMCRWPIGDPQDPAFSFCGRRKGEGPYCGPHAARAFDSTSTLGKRTGAEYVRSLRRYA